MHLTQLMQCDTLDENGTEKEILEELLTDTRIEASVHVSNAL